MDNTSVFLNSLHDDPSKTADCSILNRIASANLICAILGPRRHALTTGLQLGYSALELYHPQHYSLPSLSRAIARPFLP